MGLALSHRAHGESDALPSKQVTANGFAVVSPYTPPTPVETRKSRAQSMKERGSWVGGDIARQSGGQDNRRIVSFRC